MSQPAQDLAIQRKESDSDGSARQSEAVFSLYQNHCQCFCLFTAQLFAKLIGLVPCRGFSVSAGDGLLQTPSPSRRTALPFSHHSSLPGFCSRKAKVPGCSSVSAITAFQFFPPSHFRPNSPLLSLSPLFSFPPPAFLWKKNKVIQIRKLRNSMYTFHWDLSPYWFGLI